MPGSRKAEAVQVWRGTNVAYRRDGKVVYEGRVKINRRFITMIDALGQASLKNVADISLPSGWHLFVLDEIVTNSDTWVVEGISARRVRCTQTENRSKS